MAQASNDTYNTYLNGDALATYTGGGVWPQLYVKRTIVSNTEVKFEVYGYVYFKWIDGWTNVDFSVTGTGQTTDYWSGAMSGYGYGEGRSGTKSFYKTWTYSRGTSDTTKRFGVGITLSGGYGSSEIIMYCTVPKIPYTACGAPTSVSASGIITPSGSFTVSWSGASGGTSNAISSYQVYYKVSSNGAAPTTSDYTGTVNVTSNATSGSKTITLSSATRGHKVVCGVVTRGAAGSSYYSGIKTGGSVTINSLPAKPTITSPTAATNTYPSSTSSVSISVTAGTDTDTSQTISIYYASSADAPDSAKTKLTGNSLSISMSEGYSYARYFWSYDGLEYSSSYASVTVRRNSAPSIRFGNPTLTTKASAQTPSNQTYVTAITLPITTTSGTYGTTSKKIYYRMVYKAGNNNPLSSGTYSAWQNLSKTADGTYNITLNANDIIKAPNYSWKVQVYFNDGTESTTESAFPSNSTYYMLAPSPQATAIYNQYSNSNIANTTATFYDKVRIYYTYDNDLTNISKVTYRIGSGAENNATLGTYTYNASSGTNYINLTLPTNLTAGSTYIFKVYSTNGYFNKTFEISMQQSPIPTINSLTESPATWKPYTYNGSLILNSGITGVSGSTFYTNNNLNSADCFKVYIKGSSKINIPLTYFTTSTSTDTLIFTCNCTTNGAALLDLLKTDNPLGSDYNTSYSISWIIEITNRFGRVITYETASSYKIDFYEPLTNPLLRVYFSNSDAVNWIELVGNNTWRAQETGKIKFVSTCNSYNSLAINAGIQINRSTTTTKDTWSDYNLVTTKSMTRSGTLGFLSPYTLTAESIITVPEITVDYYNWFRSKIIRGTEIINSGASYYTKAIYHYQATNFTMTTASYSNSTFSGSATFSNAGAKTDTSYTLTFEEKLLLNSNNNWSASESSMYTRVFNTGNNTNPATSISYSVAASDLSTNPGTSWERLYTKIKLTTIITQTVGSITCISRKITYTEPYLITFNILPTVFYKKNKLGINTKSITSSEALAIHSATNNQSINIYLDNEQTSSISLSNGTLSKFIIGGGTWTGTTAAATSTINQLVIKKGAAAPTTNNLTSYEVGYATNNQTLYINDNGTIRPIGNSSIAQMALTGSYTLNELTVGNLVVTGNASFTNNIQANTINGKKPAEIIFGTTAPSKTENVLWIDTASSMYIPKVYYSSAWHPLGAVFS